MDKVTVKLEEGYSFGGSELEAEVEGIVVKREG